MTSFWERAGAGSALATAVVVGLAVVGAACGADDGEDAASAGGDGPAPTVGTTAESSPFVVEDPPDGYRLVLAGRGDYSQTWSSDSTGDDEPVTVLAPPGEGAESPDAVTVSLTGYAGFQGGLDQAAAGYPAATPEEFDIDGQRALYTPPGPAITHGSAADLVVAVGEDLAVRVRSASGTRDELAEVARRVRPSEDHSLAPEVPDPPAGLEVVGHADADVAITLLAGILPAGDDVPAGERAHTALWARLDAAGAWTTTSPTVAVSTLPGASGSLDALRAAVRARRYPEPEMRDLTVAGRPGVVLELQEDELVRRRALVTSTGWGDAVLVVTAGSQLAAPEELAAVAASMRPATADAWKTFEVEARGGPGLHPDPGAVELERGEADGAEWLFQARVDDGSLASFVIEIDPETGRSATDGELLIDPCLKLADGQRACPGGARGGGGLDVLTRQRGPVDDGGEFPGFVVVMTTRPAALLRMTGPAGVREAAFHELPGGQRRGAVIITDEPAGLACDGVAPQPDRLDLLDAAGRPLPCP